MHVESSPRIRRVCAPRAHGFTLIELIVVITILGILATMVVVNVVSRTDEARVTRVQNDFKAIEQAASMFKIDHARYPESLEEMLNPPERPNGQPSESYLKKMPRDPWSNQPYTYEISGGKIHLLSYGADQADGGEAFDSDITNQDDEER